MITDDSFSHWFPKHADRFDALVFDIDGVIHLDHQPVLSTIEFIKTLRQINYPFALLTNDACDSVAEKCKRMNSWGIDLKPEEVVSCGHGLIDLAQKQQLQDKLFFVMGKLGNPCYVESAGLRVTRNFKELSQCEGVICGEKHYDWEETFNAVVNYFIHKPEALFIVPNPDEYYPVNDGKIEIGPGAVARFIQQILKKCHVDIDLTYLGKPYPMIFEHCHLELERRVNKTLDKNRVALIGDSLTSDIKGAADFGYRSILVLTGFTSIEMVNNSPVKPDFIFHRV